MSEEEVEELRRKREERKRQQEEEEKREEEERLRREEERKKRKQERERRAKEREEAITKELEEKQKREAKEEERKKRREERERQRLEEERLEREEEERKQKEREEKKRLQEEQEEEERRKRREALKKSQDDYSSPDRGEEPRADSRRKNRIEKLLNIIKSNEIKIAIEKIVADDDMKEEATKLLNENHDELGEFFNKQDTISLILNYISFIHPDPFSLTDDERDDLMARMDFAKEAINGGIPALWRVLLQPENRHYLEQLFSLLHHESPLLPPINITTFWKSVEFLIYRRSYEISNFMYAQKEKLIPAFFKHLRDTNLMDVLYKFVDKETSTPHYKDFDPKKEGAVPGETLFWTDDIPDLILAHIGKEDNEWSDVEIDNISSFVCLVLEKFPNCKLSHQLRDVKFCAPLVALAFGFAAHAPTANGTAKHIHFAAEGQNGVGAGENGAGENGKGKKVPFRYQSTLTSLLAFITALLKFCVNTSAYSADTLPPLVSSLIYGSGGKGSRSHDAPVNVLNSWLIGKTPEFEFPIEHTKKNEKAFGILRVKCLQLLKALFCTNFQVVDFALRDVGAMKTCVDVFFHYVENNIIHSLVEDIIKMFVLREVSSLDAANNFQITQHFLDDCDLIEKLVATLRAIALNRHKFSSFKVTKLELDDTPINGKPKPSTPEREKAEKEKEKPPPPEKERPFLPPAFVGHVMNICKVITNASEKSVKLRHLVASCSGYHWGQTVLFHLGMRDSADMEWKKPFQKVDSQDNANGNASIVD